MITLPSDANASGRSFGSEELALLQRVIDAGTLNCTKGTFVHDFESQFAEFLDIPFCRAVTSGTAAIHAAVAAIDPEPGDEIITTPITDMGALTPILYQTAIPVFADVDPKTYNITASSIKRKITRRTRAVIVTHLFGNPCDMDSILEICKPLNIPVIEDCAQAYCCTYKGKKVGTIGTIGCFSLQQGKHMTAGEGGLIVTSDPTLARRITLFVDKAWGYGDPTPDHYFLALNYRMTELQGAVALAQLKKLPEMVEHRIEMAKRLTEKISDLPGISTPAITKGGTHVFWKYPLQIDPNVISGGADAFGARLKEAGIFCIPRYIQKPAYECEIFKKRQTFGKSQFPFTGEHRREDPPIIYDRNDTPEAIQALSRIVVLPWNEKYTPEHVDFISEKIRQI